MHMVFEFVWPVYRPVGSFAVVGQRGIYGAYGEPLREKKSVADGSRLRKRMLPPRTIAGEKEASVDNCTVPREDTRIPIDFDTRYL